MSSRSPRAAAVPIRGFIDIERLEALRGPQGTLYGSSSQSGTLRVITNKANPSGFDAWAEAQAGGTHSGGVSHDLSAMVNLPLVADKLSLRLVGFTSEDAGFIDNVLSTSPGGTFDNANVVDKDVNTIKTSGGRASLRWDVSDNVDLTLGALFQDAHADGHGDMSLDKGDLEQVRFEKESLDDKWYQLALTLNAELPFAEAVVSASYFDRNFRYEADATEYEFGFNQIGLRGLRFRRRPARLRHEPRAHAHHDRRGAPAVAGGLGKPLGVAGRRLLQPGWGQDGVRQLCPRIRR